MLTYAEVYVCLRAKLLAYEALSIVQGRTPAGAAPLASKAERTAKL